LKAQSVAGETEKIQSVVMVRVVVSSCGFLLGERDSVEEASAPTLLMMTMLIGDGAVNPDRRFRTIRYCVE
jgi:hypothetical protein